MTHRTATAPAPRATAPPAPAARPPWRRWRPWALAAVCGLAAALYLWGIGGSWGNTYYTAAVKSMSTSWENFFFGSLDAAGVVTVDKPPMALWVQVASVKLLGFSKVAVQLPQAIAGVAAVFLLHRTVRRWAGENAALLAALILALTPITVAINRINNPDTLLVLLVVGAAYAMTRAAEGPRATAWTALAAFLVGCGFLTKMLQAWMVLPAFVPAYLIASRAPWPRRALDLGVAGVVLVASSFWWVALTALWPAPKPYIGGSTDGSAWDLVFGYNGFGRIFGGGAGGPGGGAPSGAAEAAAGTASDAAQGMPGGGGGPGGGFSGQAGILRMFNDQLAGQISWLLPLCGLVLAAVAVSAVLRRRAGRPLDRRGAAGWVLWGGWLVVVGLVLSFAQGTMHPYYTTMLAPAIAAVAGAGLVRFWAWYRRPAGRAWLLLPLAVLTTAAWSSAVVWRTPEWHVWAGYLVIGLAAVAVVLLVVQRLGGRRGLARAALALGLAAVLAVPAAWSGLAATAASGAMNGSNPMAGPADSMGGGPGGMGGMGGGQDDQDEDAQGGNSQGGAAGTPPGGAQGGPPSGGSQGAFPQGQAPQGADQAEGAAGQDASSGGTGAPGGPGGGGASLTDEQSRMLAYVAENAGEAAVPLAVEGGAMSATSYIINSDLAVVGMGGFTGSDDAPSVEQLAQWKESGDIGFVLLGGGMGAGGGAPGGATADADESGSAATGDTGDAAASGGADGSQPAAGPMAGGSQRQEWVQENCTLVDPSAWGGSDDSGLQLYACG
ncbi:glycosyltransferase family 39 protein [Streptomonospora sp. S1-112]|uniref:Glycosyltransferase family 39 protein n=1 Tax=Streptomonospora mangrovi TaxID=2883123 RepID=A0A9X3NL72_9ACTN|nr:glycosyltransferase family 39 protein [Streptomonospora mangrovi]MDA0565328.1 glycosyltransferase family 39 protein [Streptomonospora mangrovi]